MAFTKNTLSTIASNVKQKICTRLGLDTALIDDASMINILSIVIAALQSEQYSNVEYQTRQALPSLADEEGVREWGYIKGVEYLTSITASGFIDVIGVTGSVIPQDSQLTSTNGNTYLTLSEVDIGISGTEIVGVVSEEGGEDQNLEAGEILTFVSTPIGVESDTEVRSGGVTGGGGAWTIEQYRQEILSAFASPGAGGSDADYKRWTKLAIGADYVGVYSYSTHPLDIAEGAVEIYFTIWDENHSDGIPTESERLIVKNYIDVLRPVGMGDFSVPELSTQAVDYEIDVTPNNATVQAAIEDSLEKLHRTVAPGGTLTLGQINRAISDTAGVEDFLLVSPSSGVAGADRATILSVGTITFDAL